jgi:hypothetical protein
MDNYQYSMNTAFMKMNNENNVLADTIYTKSYTTHWNICYFHFILKLLLIQHVEISS